MKVTSRLSSLICNLKLKNLESNFPKFAAKNSMQQLVRSSSWCPLRASQWRTCSHIKSQKANPNVQVQWLEQNLPMWEKRRRQWQRSTKGETAKLGQFVLWLPSSWLLLLPVVNRKNRSWLRQRHKNIRFYRKSTRSLHGYQLHFYLVTKPITNNVAQTARILYFSNFIDSRSFDSASK